MRHWLATLSVLLASCAGAPEPPPRFEHEPRRPLLPAAQAALAALRDLQPGCDLAEPTTDWRPGDRLLYAIELDESGTKRQWLLELRLRVPPGELRPTTSGDSRLVITASRPMVITMTTDDGRQIEYVSRCMRGDLTVHGPFLPHQAEPGSPDTRLPAKEVMIPEAFLRGGMFDTCEQRTRLRTSSRPTAEVTRLSDDDLRSVLAGQAALIAFLLIVQNEETLSDILWQVIDKPSFLSLLPSLFSGVKVGLDAAMDQAVLVDAPMAAHAWSDPGYRFPITITANDTPALHASILVTKPKPPLQLGAGIVSLEGSNPSDPERRIRVWIVSARRGPRAARGAGS